MKGMRAKGFLSSSLRSVSLKGRTSNKLFGVFSMVVLFFVCFCTFFLSAYDCKVGGVYELAIFSNGSRLCPLSSNRLSRKVFSCWRLDGEEQMRWALHSSPLKMAVAVLGSWQDAGLIVKFVLEGLRYTRVEILPFSSLVRKISRKAMDFSSSSSLVN